MQEEKWEIIFQGEIIAVEKLLSKGYERAVRPPGVRLVLKNSENKILLTKEFRKELESYDYRLPGGKVFDDFASYLNVRGNKKDLEKAVIEAGKLEAKEEAGVDTIKNLEIIHTSFAGATIEWTLYYLSGEILSMSEQKLHGDELHYGIEIGFYSREEIDSMIQDGLIKEDRSIAFLSSKKLEY